MRQCKLESHLIHMGGIIHIVKNIILQKSVCSSNVIPIKMPPYYKGNLAKIQFYKNHKSLNIAILRHPVKWL